MNKFPANGLHQINSGFGVEKFDWWRPYCEDLLFNQLATTTGVNALLKEGGKFEEVHFPRIEKKLNWASFPSPAGGVAATLHIVHTTEQHPASLLFILQSSSHPPYFLCYRGAVTIHAFYATEQHAVIRHTFYATEQQSPFILFMPQSSGHPLSFLYYRQSMLSILQSSSHPSCFLYYRAAVSSILFMLQSSSHLLLYILENRGFPLFYTFYGTNQSSIL